MKVLISLHNGDNIPSIMGVSKESIANF